MTTKDTKDKVSPYAPCYNPNSLIELPLFSLEILLILKGYSSIAYKRGMKAVDQQKDLFKYYYGDPPNRVSHVDLLCKGLSEYSSLYEEVSYQTMDDGKKVDMDGLKLRQELILDYNVPYYAGVNITVDDMKSTNRSGKIQFATPKTLLLWARLAAKDFCRADAYCSKWWDA